MRYLKVFISLTLVFSILSCSSVEEGFKNQRKENSDEFLVEKKSPLVLPPNFNEFPEPLSNQNTTDKNENTIKTLLSGEENNTGLKNASDKNINLEKNLIEKIKKN